MTRYRIVFDPERSFEPFTAEANRGWRGLWSWESLTPYERSSTYPTLDAARAAMEEHRRPKRPARVVWTHP